MNKKSKKRAFFVYAVICLLYVSVTLRLPDKMSMKRTTDEYRPPSKGMILPAVDAGQDEAVAPATAKCDEPVYSGPERIEPSLLIAVPVICSAIREGWVEKEGLIFVKKDAYNNVTWKKPVEILKEHNEEGIRNILSAIGQKRVLQMVRKAGIDIPPALSADQAMFGRGYTVEARRLLALYETYVGTMCDELFPFVVNEAQITRDDSGFHLLYGKVAPREADRSGAAEWMMPNLVNLPIRTAITRLSPHTANIKVHGSGFVCEQSPRPFERLKGERECIIQGRAQGQ
jgi:hypothetical protein